MGSWVTYGLGTENQNLPGFITICPTLTHGGVNNWSSRVPAGRLPGHAARQRRRPRRARSTVPFIASGTTPPGQQRLELDLLSEIEPRARWQRPAPTRRSRAASSRSSWPSACRPRRPDVQDLSKETAATHKLYGLDDQATDELRPAVPDGPAVRRGGRAVRPVHAQLQVGPARRTCRSDHTQQRAARSTSRSPGCCTDLKRARPAEGHAGALGRRVRPHADGAGRRRPRPQPARLHDVAGRRRREAAASPTARPTTTATTPSRTRSTSTTCTRRSCTCSASTTSS